MAKDLRRAEWVPPVISRSSNPQKRNVRFGSLADIARCRVDVRFTPQRRTLELSRGMSALCHKRTFPRLLDNLVGAGEQRRWNG
jgi:hypothetical protein